MRLVVEKMDNIKKIRVFSVIFVIVISFFLIPLSSNLLNYKYENPTMQSEFIHSSAETVYNQEWLDNNDFSTQDEWFYSKGALGDNSTVDASISGGSANYVVVGDEQIKEISAPLNDGTWVQFRNDIFLYPDTALINASGCYVSHDYDEDVNQTRNYHSVHWKKNISLSKDMSKYIINSASLEAIFNATVNVNVDTANDNFSVQFGIGDFATFYVLISDVDFTNPYRVANNKTSNLGQDFAPTITTITDKPIETVDEEDIITALSSSLEKDPDHSNFTITLGIDIYCEDNGPPSNDHDTWEALIINSFNLTFSYERKVEKFSSVSWNQIGDQISGDNFQISQANLKFQVKIDQSWPTSLSPFSEVRILINNNPHFESIKLSSVNGTLQDAKSGGFDVTNLVYKEVNITLSIQVFIADTFGLSSNITFSIDNVYLNITYIETFADYDTESQLFLENANKTADPFIQVPLENAVNITIKYLNQTGNHISGANVQLSGKVSGQLNENGPLEQYSRIINSTDLGIGIWSLTVTAQKANYETQIVPFFVDVVDRPTDLQLYVNGTLKTTNNTVNIKYNLAMNITISYRDDLRNQHIRGANVTITNFGDLTDINDQYTIIINSNALNLGFNVLTINAQSENYTSQTIQLYVEVFDRATEFELYVNDDQKANNDIIQIEVNQVLNLTIFYRDDITKTHLSGAEATLLTFGNFNETGTQYNYTLNSNDLSLGFNVLSMFIQLDNYQSQSIQIYVEVYDIATELLLDVDETPTSALETIQVEVNQFVNLTAFYRDNASKLHILGAIVSLGWDNFTDTGAQHYYNLSTNDLDQGITIVTIEAQFNNYQTQTIQIYFEVVERATEMEVYVDNVQRTETETILADVNQILNITVFYRDNVSKLHLPGATVTVLGGDFSQLSNQYNYSLNTNTLEQGITILTVIAYLENYQPRSFQFYVKVSERATEVSLFLNSEEKTNDPVFELPFGSSLNITVIYSDNQTDAHISGGTIQLIGDTYSDNLTENIAMDQYTLLLDTSVLKVGVNLFTIISYANNFQVKTLSLRITLNKIATVINTTSGDSYFSILPSQSLSLSIVLTDSDFGGTITNATVTYRWAYGQGILLDPENDGTYEVELEDIPTGTYTITISASAGDDYNFETFKITINVRSVTPPDSSMIFILLAGVLSALVIGFTLYEVRFKYPAIVRKSRKIRKKIKKGKKTKPIKDLTSREDSIKDHLESNVETIQLEKKAENGIKEK